MREITEFNTSDGELRAVFDCKTPNVYRRFTFSDDGVPYVDENSGRETEEIYQQQLFAECLYRVMKLESKE